MMTTARKDAPLSFRTTKELREKLETAAANAGISLAAEVEHRLLNGMPPAQVSSPDDDAGKSLDDPTPRTLVIGATVDRQETASGDGSERRAPNSDWADALAVEIISEVQRFSFNSARKLIAERLRVLEAKSELRGYERGFKNCERIYEGHLNKLVPGDAA